MKVAGTEILDIYVGGKPTLEKPILKTLVMSVLNWHYKSRFVVVQFGVY